MDGARHFDAVVVGSGFGGSVTAYRLAEAGLRVCVLERGKAYPPGSFPRDPRGVATNFWDPSEGLHGMFNVWAFKGIDALVSSGLGGGSLIYANVLIRKDEHWFTEDRPGTPTWRWPIDRQTLDPHYDAVEQMLGATPFPYDQPGYRAHKTAAMQHAAAQAGLDWQLPNLAITFARDGHPPRIGDPIDPPAYGNIHGRSRSTCRMWGECDLGCNVGAKNTLDHTYLSAAAHHGADIRTRCEVRQLGARPGGGFTVRYVEHHPDTEGRPTATGSLPHQEMTADRLIMAAGALGTPYLLLRNQSGFPRLGPALGTRFSGNGDLLGFMSRAKDTDGAPMPLGASRAPVITSTIRVPDRADGGRGRGYYIQDAGYPVFADWLVEASGAPGALRRALWFGLQRLWARIRRDPVSDLSARIAQLVGDGSRSASLMPLLGMGRDTPDGQMSLQRGHLAIDWTVRSSRAYFREVQTTMRAIATALDARFDKNPTSYLKRVITVHPLGGAPMGYNIEEGVVDGNGQSFAYPGLYVVDGAAMPGPVGPNPALTIAAFADHASDHILAEVARGQTIANAAVSAAPISTVQQAATDHVAQGQTMGESTTVPAVSAGAKQPTSVRFTEEMKGFVALGLTDPEAGYEAGKRDDTTLMFRLTIHIDDIDAFVTDPDRPGRAEGYVDSDRFGGRLPVGHGAFNLFVPGDTPAHRRMLYRLFFADGVGNPLTLSGFKDVYDDPGFDVWSDTSTLYVTLYRGHVDEDGEADAEVVGAGVLHILKLDFARQMTTFRTTGPDRAARIRGLANFGRLFLGELWSVYGPAVASDADGDADAPPAVSEVSSGAPEVAPVASATRGAVDHTDDEPVR